MADLAGNFFDLPIVEDLPDQRWDGAEVPRGYLEDLPDQRWGAGLVFNDVTIRFLMKGFTNPGGTLIYWINENEPDYTGTNAPQPVSASTIVLVREM